MTKTSKGVCEPWMHISASIKAAWSGYVQFTNTIKDPCAFQNSKL